MAAVMVSVRPQTWVPFHNITVKIGGHHQGPGGVAQDGLEGDPAGLVLVGPDGEEEIQQQEDQPTQEPAEVYPLLGGEHAVKLAAAEDKGKAQLHHEQGVRGQLPGRKSGFHSGYRADPEKSVWGRGLGAGGPLPPPPNPPPPIP